MSERKGAPLKRIDKIRFIIFVSLLILLFGCGGKRADIKKPETEKGEVKKEEVKKEEKKEKESSYSTSKDYRASYDDVWNALSIALRRYPVILMDKGKGVINTDWHVYPEEKKSPEEKVKLSIKVEDKEEVVRISIGGEFEVKESSFLSSKWVQRKSEEKRENSILEEVQARLKAEGKLKEEEKKEESEQTEK